MAEQETKYLTIVNWIRNKISSGELHPGDKIMSENEMSKFFGVSRQTVRHATTELVEQHILTRSHGSGTFVSNSSRLSRGKKFSNIAVVCTFSESYIGPLILKGIESVLFSKGYSSQVFFTDNKISLEKEILKSILEKDNIDGLIFEPTKSALPSPNLDLYRELSLRSIPILSYNASYPELPAPCVRIDDTQIAYRAVMELVKRGHTRIAGIFKSDDIQGLKRYQGYIKALSDSGIMTDQNRVSWFDTPILLDFDSSEDFVFKRIGDSTAVLCYNDQIAYALVNLAIKRGLKVPEELSIVGIDDSDLAGLSPVSITSFSHPKELLGAKVAENMVKMIEDSDYDGNYLYDSEIIVRDSVKNILQ